MNTMIACMKGYMVDEQGIETLEWIAIGALILGVAFAVYPGTLESGLNTVVSAITSALEGEASAIGS